MQVPSSTRGKKSASKGDLKMVPKTMIYKVGPSRFAMLEEQDDGFTNLNKEEEVVDVS